MKTSRIVHVVSAHAEGEVGDVIVGGVAPPPGDTLWEMRDFIERDETLRNFVLNEPRGGVFRHVNFLVPPKHPDADAAFLIMEPEDTPPMSGSNTICVATVLLETGILPMQQPVTDLTLEVPAGLIRVQVACSDDGVDRVTFENVASFADQLDAMIEVPGIGALRVDTAFGGDSYVIVDAADLGIDIGPDTAADMARLGDLITDAANDQLGFDHPENDWGHISFCQFAGPLERTLREDGSTLLTGPNAVVIKPGKLDRSPCGTGSSARMAVMAAKGQMGPRDLYLSRSVIGSEFHCRILGAAQVGNRAAIRPEISGRAWITGTHQHSLDPRDPFPTGYRVRDTWGPNQQR